MVARPDRNPSFATFRLAIPSLLAAFESPNRIDAFAADDLEIGRLPLVSVLIEIKPDEGSSEPVKSEDSGLEIVPCRVRYHSRLLCPAVFLVLGDNRIY